MPRDKTGHFYYPAYPTIWQSDTSHLTLAEDGAYHRLVDHYMLTRSPLPEDDRSLARILGVGLDEWLIVKAAVVAFFKPLNGRLMHTFCDAILAEDNARISRARINGKGGGRPSVSKQREITHSVTTSKPLGSPNTTQHNTTQNKTPLPPEGDGEIFPLEASVHFESFMAVYPSRANRKDALTAFNEALKKTTLLILLAKGAEYGRSVVGKEDKYIQAAGRWLDNERWKETFKTAEKTNSPYSRENPQICF